jgi:hypothetical protein
MVSPPILVVVAVNDSLRGVTFHRPDRAPRNCGASKDLPPDRAIVVRRRPFEKNTHTLVNVVESRGAN